MPDTTADGSTTPADTTSTTASTPVDASQSQTAAPTDKPADAPAQDKPAQQPTDKPVEQPKTGDDPKPADKPADDKPADVAYEFKLPEGVTLKDEALDELKGLAKELGLTQENAQKIADLGAKQAQAFTNQLVEYQRNQTAEWANATKADKELGGDALDANLGVAKKALDAYATPELKKLLNDSGLGNHPEVIRTFFKVGKAISEDGKIVTGSAGQQSRESVPIENRLYPNQK